MGEPGWREAMVERGWSTGQEGADWSTGRQQDRPAGRAEADGGRLEHWPAEGRHGELEHRRAGLPGWGRLWPEVGGCRGAEEEGTGARGSRGGAAGPCRWQPWPAGDTQQPFYWVQPQLAV